MGEAETEPAMVGFIVGFSFCLLVLAALAGYREVQKNRRIRQYLTDRDGFVMRRSAIGGWHGEYKRKLAGGGELYESGGDSASLTHSESDNFSQSHSHSSHDDADLDNEDTLRSQRTIMFSG